MAQSTKTKMKKIHVRPFFSPAYFWFVYDSDLLEKKAFINKIQHIKRYFVCENPQVNQVSIP